MKKFVVSCAVMMLGVTGVMHVAIADPVDRETVCVVSAGQGHPNVEVTVGAPAADAPAFDSAPCGGGGGGGFGGFGRVSAADTAEELADTP